MKATALGLSSGGKDSILAIHLASKSGLEITGIVTALPEDEESMLYHIHNVMYVRLIAKSMGIEWYPVKAPLSWEEKALSKELDKHDETILVTGGVASNYQKERFERVAREVGMKTYSPIWGMDANKVLRLTLELGFDTLVVAVAALGLEEEWLGRHLDRENVDVLLNLSKKNRFNAIGEGGDYDTFILDAPLYRRRLEATKVSKTWFGESGRLEILEMSLVEKG